MPSRCYYDQHFSDRRTAGNREVFSEARKQWNHLKKLTTLAPPFYISITNEAEA
jgi:hypothetical protein